VGVGEVWKARDDDANEKGGVEGEANGEKESEVGRQRNLHERRRSIILIIVYREQKKPIKVVKDTTRWLDFRTARAREGVLVATTTTTRAKWESEANGEKESEVGRQRNLHERRRSIILVVVKT